MAAKTDATKFTHQNAWSLLRQNEADKINQLIKKST